MPTLIQMTFRLILIVAFTAFWSALTVANLVYKWWRKRGRYFVTIRHQRPAVLDSPEWTHRYVKLSKLQMHYVETGDPTNPRKMVFLHGFPEFWYSWRFQLRHFGRLAHCVALDLRGYNESDKPSAVSDYSVDLVIEDVRELIEKLGGRATVVGHDWGGIVAWILAMKYPGMLDQLVVVNVPHPAVMMKLIRSRSAQLLKSWYVFMFQTPFLPELAIYANDYESLEKTFRGNYFGLVHAEHFTDEDVEAWKYVFSKPNALTPPINYYRAWIRSSVTSHLPPLELIRIRTLLIWGERDRALICEGVDMSAQLCADVQVLKVPDASHWCQQDVPELVNLAIEQFIFTTPTGEADK